MIAIEAIAGKIASFRGLRRSYKKARHFGGVATNALWLLAAAFPPPAVREAGYDGCAHAFAGTAASTARQRFVALNSMKRSSTFLW